MKSNTFKTAYYLNEFELLFDIRDKISSGIALNKLEECLWEEWLSRPHVREHQFVTIKTFKEMLQIHEQKLPWDKFLEKMEDEEIKEIATQDAQAKVAIQIQSTDLNIRHIINWTYEKILLARRVLLLIMIVCAVIYLFSKPTVDAYKKTIAPSGANEEYIFSDGTYIWLNAGSTLTFPGDFSGAGKRYVELDGEAYFIVKYNTSYTPFRVITQSQKIETSTAQFNVDAYSDNKFQRTSLLAGTLTVKPGIDTGISILRPGEQYVTTGNTHLKLDTLMRPMEITAWRNNYFSFHQVTLGEIMKKVEKWYDVKIVVEEAIANKLCTVDSIPRKQLMGTVLDIMGIACGFRYKPESGFKYGDTIKIVDR